MMENLQMADRRTATGDDGDDMMSALDGARRDMIRQQQR